MRGLWRGFLLSFIGLGLGACLGNPAPEQSVEAAVPTSTPAPTVTVPQILSTEPAPATVAPTEVAAEMSEPELPESEPDTPTPTSSPTPLPVVEEVVQPEEAVQTKEAEAPSFIIPGNPDLDYAQVIFVKASQSSDGSWKFDVTVRHDDQGWDDYADAWLVVQPETEAVLGERILLHPHDTEQPFTRSQSGIIIPDGVTQVIVRAKDNVEGFGGQEVIVDLTVAESEFFAVIR